MQRAFNSQNTGQYRAPRFGLMVVVAQRAEHGTVDPGERVQVPPITLERV